MTTGVTVTENVTRNVTTEERREKREERSLSASAEREKRARAVSPGAATAEGDEPVPEPASEARDMRETLLQALPMKFRWEADVRDDIDQFVADFAGRFAEVTAAIAACRREREIPFPRNLRGHLPAVPGGSNDGRKRDARGRAADPDWCPGRHRRWDETDGFCGDCGEQEPDDHLLRRRGVLA